MIKLFCEDRWFRHYIHWTKGSKRMTGLPTRLLKRTRKCGEEKHLVVSAGRTSCCRCVLLTLIHGRQTSKTSRRRGRCGGYRRCPRRLRSSGETEKQNGQRHIPAPRRTFGVWVGWSVSSEPLVLCPIMHNWSKNAPPARPAVKFTPVNVLLGKCHSGNILFTLVGKEKQIHKRVYFIASRTSTLP